MLKDYGLHLLENGYGSGHELIFADFRFYSISVIAPGRYTTMVELPAEGQVFAASFDYDESILKLLLRHCSPQEAEALRNKLAAVGVGRTARFEEPIAATVNAVLTSPVRNKNETFVPLRIASVT